MCSSKHGSGLDCTRGFCVCLSMSFHNSPSLPRLKTEEEDPKKHATIPSGKGSLLILDREFQAIVNNHCLLNAPIMGKWVDMYVEVRTTREREREAWKRLHGGRWAPPFPKELAKYPNLIPVGWIDNSMTKTKAQGEQISPKEWEYARGSLTRVIYWVCVCVCVCVCVWGSLSSIVIEGLHIQLYVVRRASFLSPQDRWPLTIVELWATLTRQQKRWGIVEQ